MSGNSADISKGYFEKPIGSLNPLWSANCPTRDVLSDNRRSATLAQRMTPDRPDREVQVGYCDEATSIIHEMSGGRQPKDNIYINVVHAVDGAWNFGGKALNQCTDR
jgi:hypothetical protein